MKTTLLTLAICLGSILGLGQELIPFEGENGKFGFKDKAGNEVIAAKYDDVWNFSEGFAVVSMGCEWGINAEMENQCTGGKWGFVNENGKEFIPVEYSEAYSFKEGFAVVFIGGNIGYGMSGNIEQLDSMKTQRRKLTGYTLINKNGQAITRTYYDNAYSFREGMAKVERDGKFGYVNYKGDEAIPLMYDEAVHFFDGKAEVTLNGRTFYIDIKGNEIKDYTQNNDTLFIDQIGYVYFSVGNKCGYMDNTRKIIIPCIYDGSLADERNSQGLIGLKLNGKWGFVDTLNNVKVPFIYDDALPYIGDYCLVKNEKKWICLDRMGNENYPIKYNPSKEGYIKVYSTGENAIRYAGLINTLGEEIIPCKFSEIYTVNTWTNLFFHDKHYKSNLRGKCKVSLDGRTFYIDTNGNEIK